MNRVPSERHIWTCGQISVKIWAVPLELKPLFYFLPRIEILGYDMGRGAASFFDLNPGSSKESRVSISIRLKLERDLRAVGSTHLLTMDFNPWLNEKSLFFRKINKDRVKLLF